MSQFLLTASPIGLWLPALAIIFATNLLVAALARPLGRFRWPLAGIVLLAPATFPAAESYTPPAWGTLSTLLTTMAIVSAARLPGLDRLFATGQRRRSELFFWMAVPMARFWPKSHERRSQNRSRAARFLVSGALKRLAWEPLALLTARFDGADLPWPVASAILILYFVLNVTAAADLLTALCLALGCDVDVLFDAPLLSRSARDFWSSRWNRFISRFALKHVALPLGKRFGAAGVLFFVFATSGVFHEYFAWGVGGAQSRPYFMSVFFLIQAVFVWGGTRLPLPTVPPFVGTAFTFVWMTLTAPLFFAAIEPALQAFGFPPSWMPRPHFLLLLSTN